MDNTSTVGPPTPDADTAVGRQTVSERVIAAVADVTDTAPKDLTPPLFSAVDPEALDAVVESLGDGSHAPESRVEFAYCGCDVTVKADGRVIVTATDDA